MPLPTNTPKPEFGGLLVGRGNDTNLYLVEPGSDNVRLLVSVGDLVPGGQPRNPRWARDGSAIVFWVRDAGGSAIFVVNADGSNLRRVIADSDSRLRPAQRKRERLQVQNPGWSPDGSAIVFSAVFDDGSGNYWVIGVDGDGLRPLTSWPEKAGADYTPVTQEWSPDGSVIALQTKSDRINFISPRGGNGAFVTNGFLGGWGLDGRLYLGKNGDTSLDSVVYSVNLDGGDLQPFAEGALTGADPRWSGDGKHIYYAISRTTYNVAEADGSRRRPLKAAGLFELDWR